jgi:hypothetical protein
MLKTEKRRHKRFPVLKDMAEPVDLFVMDHPAREVPAVLTNLSGGGMSLVVFAHVSGDARLKMILDIHGLENLELLGRVAWTEPKGDTTAIGRPLRSFVPRDPAPHQQHGRGVPGLRTEAVLRHQRRVFPGVRLLLPLRETR